MAAALFRRGPGVCCIHRELCRFVWRPQAALFSSKPPDRKQQPPRRTHIKKAKSQPAVDIAKLLEELFNQRRPGTAPPVAQPTKPPTASSVNVSAAASVPPAARSLSGVTVPTTSGSSPTGATPASLSSEAAAVECRTSMETIETGVGTTTEPVELETASRRPLSDHVAEEVAETSSLPAALVEPLIEPTVEPAPEKSPSLLETLENRSAVGEGSVETTIEVEADTAALPVQTDGTDSGPVNLSHATEEEPLIETTIESPEASHFTVGTIETRAAAVEGPVEPPIDVTVDVSAQKVETKSTDSGPVNLSHATEEEPLIETTIESPEASHFTVGTIETRAAPVEGPVEPPIDVTVDVAAQKVETKSTDSGPVNLSHATEEEPLIETTIESSDASHFTVGTIETRAAAVEGPVETPIDVAAQKVETKSTDSGPVNLSHATEDQPLIETTIEPAVEASPVSEGTIEPAIETESGDNLSHSALIQSAEGSAPWTPKNEPTIESTVESVNVAAEAGGNRSEEEMTLESVTLHVDRVLLASFKTDELLQTKSLLDEEADKEVRELSVQTEIRTESSSEDEHEILTEALSKWDSLSEDLREFEGESGALVEELFCHAPPKTPRSLDPPVGERTEEKVESLTLAEAEAEVGGLETEVLLETRNALEEEADLPAEEEKVEVGTTMDEETSEAEFFTLDSISEAVVLQSVTLAEVEASLGTLEKESLSESTNCLDEAAEIVARGQKATEVEDGVVPPEALSLGGVDELPEDLQIDALMEELLLFSVPASVAVARADALDDDLQASPALKVEEVLLEEEKEEEKEEGGAQAEALENEDGQETHADLDPVQRLFLEKIKEYNNMRRLNGGLLEAEPDYEKYLSEETAKLRRLYGGGDLSSFPQFTFTEPQLDQDSK